VIAHGAATARAAAAACVLADDLARSRITDKISELLAAHRGGPFRRRS
jgi:fatty acid/phospholipid biosynthesis enzyme